jgi:hypothetical protein
LAGKGCGREARTGRELGGKQKFFYGPIKETLKNDPISPSSPLESVIFDLAACFNPIFGSFWAF